MLNLWRRGRRSSKTTLNNWGAPCWYRRRIFPPPALIASNTSVRTLAWSSLCACACVCVFECMLKMLFIKVCCSSGSFGTESSLSVKHYPSSAAAACSLVPCTPPPSLPHPYYFLSQLFPSAQAHICCNAELCWRIEEVGTDWHMVDGMWTKREWKEEEQLFKHFHSGLLVSSFKETCSRLHESTCPCFQLFSFVYRSLTGIFQKNTTKSGATKMSRSAGE